MKLTSWWLGLERCFPMERCEQAQPIAPKEMCIILPFLQGALTLCVHIIKVFFTLHRCYIDTFFKHLLTLHYRLFFIPRVTSLSCDMAAAMHCRKG